MPDVSDTAAVKCERQSRRLALLFSDGAYTVFPSDWPIERAREEARDCDVNETDPAHFTTLVEMTAADVEVLEVPSLKAMAPHTGKCPHCGAAAKP